MKRTEVYEIQVDVNAFDRKAYGDVKKVRSVPGVRDAGHITFDGIGLYKLRRLVGHPERNLLRWVPDGAVQPDWRFIDGRMGIEGRRCTECTALQMSPVMLDGGHSSVCPFARHRREMKQDEGKGASGRGVEAEGRVRGRTRRVRRRVGGADRKEEADKRELGEEHAQKEGAQHEDNKGEEVCGQRI